MRLQKLFSLKKILYVCLFFCLFLSQNTLIFAQNTPVYKKYKRDFLDNVNIQLSLGYGQSDMQTFNDWGRTASYKEMSGNYTNINFRATYTTIEGVFFGLEWFTNAKTTTNVMPAQEAFGLRFGYHIRTFGEKNRWHLNFTTGLALNWTKIKFPNGNPPDAYLFYNFDRRKAFLRQTSTLITPEIELMYTFKEASESTFFLSFKGGMAVNAFRGAWKYGEHYQDNNGNSKFDYEVVYDVPNTLDQIFYFNIGIGYLLPTD